MLDPSEADTIEELAELAVSFFEVDLRAGRCSVLHGDEQHRRAVVQCFSGFRLHELDLLDWIQWTWESRLQPPGTVLSLSPAEFRGRHAVLVSLHAEAEFVGLFHLDREAPFDPESLSALTEFSALYQRRLTCLLPPSLPVPGPHQAAEPEPAELWHPEIAWMDCY